MFESSRDILNLVAAISIAALAFFLCWALYYIISTVRHSFKVVKKVEQGVDKAESLIDLVKEKIFSSASYLMIISNLVKKGVEIFENRKTSTDNDFADNNLNEKASKRKNKNK